MHNGSYTPVNALAYSLLLQLTLRLTVSFLPLFIAGDSVLLIIKTILEILTFALPAVVFFRTSGVSPDRVILYGSKFPAQPVFSACAVLSVITATGFVSDRIFLFILTLKNPQSCIKESGMVIQSATILYYIVMFAAKVPIAALTEEIFYRGIVLNTLAVYNRTSALVIQALLFGLIHENPVQFFYTACGGFFLGLLTLESESLVFAVIVHMINNVIILLFQYADIPYFERLIAVVFAAGVAGLVMIIMRTETNVKQPVPFGRLLSVFILSPPMVIYLMLKIPILFA